MNFSREQKGDRQKLTKCIGLSPSGDSPPSLKVRGSLLNIPHPFLYLNKQPPDLRIPRFNFQHRHIIIYLPPLHLHLPLHLPLSPLLKSPRRETPTPSSENFLARPIQPS